MAPIQKEYTATLELVTSSPETGKEMVSALDELARQGARRMLMEALELEAREYIVRHRDERNDDGKALVVGNGKAKSRTVVVGCGQIDVRAPRVRDNRINEKFLSKILPPYIRKSPNVESVIPILYLKGQRSSRLDRKNLADKTGQSYASGALEGW